MNIDLSHRQSGSGHITTITYSREEKLNSLNAAGVKELQDAFRKNDNIKELLVSIVISDLFRYRNAGGTQP